jgi:hypothetical protein
MVHLHAGPDFLFAEQHFQKVAIIAVNRKLHKNLLS